MISDSGGQTALVDAIIFMILMSLASGIILGAGTNSSVNQLKMEGLQQYSDDFADAMLAIELENPDYIDFEGDIISINGSARNIGQLLCDGVIIKSGGQANISSYGEAIENTGNSLIRPGLGYAVYSHVEGQENHTIFLSGQIDNFDELPDQRYASQRLYDVTGTIVSITIFVWVIS